jgi:hypothetical protein
MKSSANVFTPVMMNMILAKCNCRFVVDEEFYLLWLFSDHLTK